MNLQRLCSVSRTGWAAATVLWGEPTGIRRRNGPEEEEDL